MGEFNRDPILGHEKYTTSQTTNQILTGLDMTYDNIIINRNIHRSTNNHQFVNFVNGWLDIFYLHAISYHIIILNPNDWSSVSIYLTKIAYLIILSSFILP